MPIRRAHQTATALAVITTAAVTLLGATGPASAAGSSPHVGPRAASPDAAPPASTPGSIVYVQGRNVWISTPDGATKRQVTHDGTTPSPNGTGSTGYAAPSESDAGVVAAVRNQTEDSGLYLTGFIHLMDRAGHETAVLHPAQYNEVLGGGCAQFGGVQQAPQGIVNAVISPDGQHIAYTATTEVVTATCDVIQGYGSWVANADGTNAHQITSPDGNDASIEVGQWAGNTRLLVDRADFGSIEDFYLDLPASTATHWTAPASDDYIDSTYGQPDVRSGILATEGYSEYASRIAVRLWTTSGFGSQPSPKCDYTSPVNDSATDEILTRPSLSPDGQYVVWEDSKYDGTVAVAGQGIYALATSTINNGCATNSSLLIQSGEDPFWATGGLYAAPAVSFTSRPPAYTGSSVLVGFTVVDDAGRPVTTTCALDGGAAAPCTSPYAASGLGAGAHSLKVTAADGQQTGSAQVSWTVDTTPPTVGITGPTDPVTLAGATTVTWRGGDSGAGVGHYQVRRSGSATGPWTAPAAWSAVSGTSLRVAGLPAGTSCFDVRAVDRAGNASAWSAARCTAVPVDDRSLKASHGWKRVRSAKDYGGGAVTTTAKGKTLTLTGAATLDRVGVVAMTCKKCGTVGLYVGPTLVGKLRLKSAKTEYRVVSLLPAFATRSGTVKLKVLTKGKQVTVDGLVVSSA
jgi:hypothetical protein